jgi:hypothetical protein
MASIGQMGKTVPKINFECLNNDIARALASTEYGTFPTEESQTLLSKTKDNLQYNFTPECFYIQLTLNIKKKALMIKSIKAFQFQEFAYLGTAFFAI